MNLPLLKDVLTDPDEFLSNGQLKAFALELLALLPLEEIGGRVVCAMFERVVTENRIGGTRRHRS